MAETPTAAPPAAVSQMTAPAPQGPRMVKIRAIQTIAIGVGPEGVTVKPGDIVEVSESDAKEFCDRVFVNNYSHAGEHDERFAESSRHKVKRAERV